MTNKINEEFVTKYIKAKGHLAELENKMKAIREAQEERERIMADELGDKDKILIDGRVWVKSKVRRMITNKSNVDGVLENISDEEKILFIRTIPAREEVETLGVIEKAMDKVEMDDARRDSIFNEIGLAFNRSVSFEISLERERKQ